MKSGFHSFVLVCVAFGCIFNIANAAPKSVVAEGSAIIQDSHSPSIEQMAKARMDAIADGLQKIAMSQSSHLISHSHIGPTGNLKENIFLEANLPIHQVIIENERKLGGLYRANIRVIFKDDSFNNKSKHRKMTCTASKPSLRKEISLIINSPEYSAPPDNDVINALQTTKALLSKKLNYNLNTIFIDTVKKGQSSHVYDKSFLSSNNIDNQYRIYLSSFETNKDNPDYDANDQALTLGQVASSIASAGKSLITLPLALPKLVNPNLSEQKKRIGIRVHLPNNESFEYVLPKVSVNPVNNIQESEVAINDWLNRDWKKIQQSLHCLPIRAKASYNNNNIYLTLGSDHGLSKGQHLLLLNDGMNLQIYSSSNADQTIGLYRVETVGKKESSLKSINGYSSNTLTGQKIVIPF